jgi:hypothetical protein
LKYIIVALLCVFALNAFAERYSLSREEIRRMGVDSWIKYCQDKGGILSEVDEDEAYRTFADAQKSYNEKQLSKLDRDDRNRLKKYKKLFTDFRLQILDIESLRNGGGSMFGHMAERGSAYDELLMEKLIKLNEKSNHFNPVFQAQKAAKLVRQIENRLEKSKNINSDEEKALEFMAGSKSNGKKLLLKEIKKATGNFEEMCGFLKGRPASERLLILDFYWSHSKPLN